MFECFVWLCATFAVLQVLGAVWCAYELRNKSVPELWGLDWLDILYRLERDFQLTFGRGDFEAVPAAARAGLTAGRLWEIVAAKLRAEGRPIPVGGWDTLVAALVEALHVKPFRVSAESRLYADLGMSRDIT